MLFLDRSYHLKEIGDVGKSLFSRRLGKVGIHLLPLILLAVRSDLKVVLGVMYALKDLVPDLGVLFLVSRCLLEDLGDLDISVLFRLGSEISILIARLGLARNLLRAWDSPANASIRLSNVLVPIRFLPMFA